jgi:PAS domain S-box-containing protein
MSISLSSPGAHAAVHGQQSEVDDLRGRLAEAEETLSAIRRGEIDAIVLGGESGPQVYTLLNADRPYRTFVEHMQEGALTLTPGGTVLYANRCIASLLGLALFNVVGQKFTQFVAEDDRVLFERLLAEGDAGGGKSELALRGADGSVIPVYLSMMELPDEDQKTVSAIVTDLRWSKQRLRELAEANAMLVSAMAERERVEAMLRQAQKMEAVGQLTAGIAHDFNNLLAVIGGNLELFHTRTDDPWLRCRVEASQRAVGRGARLTGQLLAFSRVQTLHPHLVSVTALLHDIEPLLSSSVGDQIRLTLVLSDVLAECMVDPTELQAAILNLVRNAADAMPSGGRLTITTEPVVLEHQPDRGAGPITGGRYLSIAVTDTGHGIPTEIRDRVFDPFFTTKDVGQGTGLGLSQVYGFMRQSGGQVTIESAPGGGTSVRLFLPWSEGNTPPREPLAAIHAALNTLRARRVLVVEDDGDVREMLVEMLEHLGCTVMAAESGPQALAMLEKGAAVDVVVSDVLMPDGMSGFQLAEQIRARLPHLAIVLTSGMAGSTTTAEAAEDNLPVLRKPYRFEDMSQAIEAAIDAVSLM